MASVLATLCNYFPCTAKKQMSRKSEWEYNLNSSLTFTIVHGSNPAYICNGP